jgi:hypothetical protein
MEQLAKMLYEWFTMRRSEGISITGPLLIEKAKYFYAEMNLTDKCNFSEGWLTCFKMRNGIRRLDVSGEKISSDKECAEKYFEVFQKHVEKHKLTTEKVYNADETGFLYRCLPNSALAGGGEVSASGHKSNKERLTVLCVQMLQEHKLQLFVVGKLKNPRVFKNVQHLS